MKLVFVSNYFNHHQRQLCDELAKRWEFTFLAAEQLPQDRMQLGWGETQVPDYVCDLGNDPRRGEAALQAADVILAGSAPEELVSGCIRAGKPVFRYQERPLKKGNEPLKYLPRLIRWHLRNPRRKPVYLLCASAYTARDYRKFGLFRGKAFRWGYFPQFKPQDISALTQGKQERSLLWVGRMLSWKHPLQAVELAARLKAEGVSFTLEMIGTGPQEQLLRQRVQALGLSDCVRFPGAMKPEQVRQKMEQAQIFLFTSDRQEGWGAVLNEAMNSGCAVVACEAAGATPYLIRDGENGFCYPEGNSGLLHEKVRLLLDDSELCSRLGQRAYQTIAQLWNPCVAAERLTLVAQAILRGKEPERWNDGPCSPEK